MILRTEWDVNPYTCSFYPHFVNEFLNLPPLLSPGSCLASSKIPNQIRLEYYVAR